MKLVLPCALLLLLSSLAAQDTPEPKSAQRGEPKSDRFRIGLALASGTVDFDQGGPFNDSTNAGLLRLQFEFVGNKQFGAGLRIESLVSDDDLFRGAGSASEERNSDIFAHVTWRLGSDRFRMPLRLGVLVNRLQLEADVGGATSNFRSAGPYVELAPEFTLASSGKTRWSLYGEGGIGWAATRIELDGVSQKYDSTTVFVGAELGTRLSFGMFEIGLAYVGRFQHMERSDSENGSTIASFDANFQGALLSFALRF